MLYMIREEVDRYQQRWITHLLMLVMATIKRKGNESFDNGFFFDIEQSEHVRLLDVKIMNKSASEPLD